MSDVIITEETQVVVSETETATVIETTSITSSSTIVTTDAPQGEQGVQGVQGIQGIQGITGQGVASGGLTGYMLVKQSDSNYDTGWTTRPTALADLTSDATHRVVTDAWMSTWNGKQDSLGFAAVPDTRTVGGHALSSNVALDDGDINVSRIDTPTSVTTVSDFFDCGWSAGVVSGGDITDNGDGTVDVAAGEALLRTSASETAPIISLAFSQSLGIALADGSTTYIYVSYNAASPILNSSTVVTSFNCLDKCHLYSISREGTSLYILDARQQNVDANRKARKRNYETNPYAHILGGSEIGHSGLYPQVTAGGFYFSYVRIAHSAFDCSLVGTTIDRTFVSHWQNNVGVWQISTTEKQIDNTHYDNGGVALATLTDGYYGVHWIYLALGVVPRLIQVYGTGDYATLVAAKAAGVPASLPISASGSGVLLGQCIIQKGNTTIDLVQSAFSVSFTPSSATLPSVAGDNGQVQYNNNGVLGADANFTWDDAVQSVNIGGSVILSDNPLAVSGSADAYLQINLQNRSVLGSADVVITADDGNDSEKYADVGICNSEYASVPWDVVDPHDTYLFGDGGNVVVGSLSVGKKIKFFVAQTEHESHPEDIVAEMDSNGINLPTGKSYRANGLDMKSFSIAMAVALG